MNIWKTKTENINTINRKFLKISNILFFVL